MILAPRAHPTLQGPLAGLWEEKAQGRQGLVLGPSPGAALLTGASLGISPAPSQAPGQACVCCGDLGWPRGPCLSFLDSFACFAWRGQQPADRFSGSSGAAVGKPGKRP